MIDLNKLRSEFEAIKEIQDSIRREQLIFNTKLGCYTKKSGKMCVSANWTNGAWFIFERKAKAQAVPEGYVLVEKSKIHKWYQDANEPESFSNDDSDDGLRSLGDLIDDYGIMEVEIHESALISTKKAFGVWKSKSPTDICTNFVLVETLEEAEKILADNKAMYESESGAEG